MTQTPPEIPEYGGCLWPVDPACMTAEWEALEESVKIRALALASSTLARLTAYRVGGCPIKVRPVPKRNMCYMPRIDMSIEYPGSSYEALYIAGPQRSCTVALPAPVMAVQEVKVNGEVVDWYDYRVDNGNLLVYTGDGDCLWPETQDLDLDDDQPGTFSITYWNSAPPDSLGAYAAGVLAMEFAKACSGSNKCRLPTGVTSVVRAGISMEIQSGSFPGGFTGIREVDAFIALWNPRGSSQPYQTRVWTPSQRYPRIDTAGGTPPPSHSYDGGAP